MMDPNLQMMMERRLMKIQKKESECNYQEKEDNVNSTNNVNAASTNEFNNVGRKISIELPFDLNMHALEDYSIFDSSRDDEDDGAVADMNNLDTTIQVSPNPTTRIHKDHPLDQVIGDLQSATKTKKMSKNLKEHGTQKGNSCIEGSKLDRGYAGIASTIQVTRSLDLVDLPNGKRAIGKIVIRNKARLVAQGYTQEERIDYDEVFAPVARIEAIRLFLAYASFNDFVVFEDPYFPIDIQFKKHYMTHQAPRAWYETLSTYLLDNGFQREEMDKSYTSKHKEVKTASTPIETQKPLLKDKDGEKVDVHMYRSMIGSLMYLTSSRPDIMFAVCAYARYQVNPKVFTSYTKKGFLCTYKSTKIGPLDQKNLHLDLVAYTDSNYAGASWIGIKHRGYQFLGCRLISRQCKKQIVVANSTTEVEDVAASSCCGQFADTHNLVTFLSKPAESEGFEQIVDFLNANPIRYALTINPTIYTSCIKQFWATAKVKTINGEVQLQALVDGKKIIVTEASVFTYATIFEELTRMGYEKLSQKLTFYKAFFDS
ncbi:uncharacterized mitochondrial protein-like protein [Tanacetum coccineum]